MNFDPTAFPPLNLLGITRAQLVADLKTVYNKGAFHADALYRAVFKDGSLSPLSTSAFVNSPALARSLASRLSVSPARVVKTKEDSGLLKFVTRLSDGLEIESVVIPMKGYETLCVSCQVGCRMGCRFCRTGAMGFRRNLSANEIVGQIFNARHTLGRPVTNVVFMGMGEPFDNLDAVVRSIRVMSEQKGLDIAQRHITVSTAGLVDGIRAMAGLNLGRVKLAVSIHAPDDARRSAIMPVNRRHSLASLKGALRDYPLPGRGTFLFEYILIKGFNDAPDDAVRLARYIRPLKVRLNLMAHNRTRDLDYPPVTDGELNRFAQWLRQEGVFVVKRWKKGDAIGAACGQLATQPSGTGPVA